MTSETGSGAETASQDARRIGKAAREIGHDLNNCLGVVGGRAELVLMYLDKGNSDGARKGIDVILAQMERMKGLTDALRDLDPAR